MKKLGWQDWLQERREVSAMSVSRIRLDQVRGWGMRSDGYFGRPDDKFFRFGGIRIASAGREVVTWDQPMLEETGQGRVVLVEKRRTGEILLAARPEPGCTMPGHIILGPALQASKANLEQAHGGKRPPRAELLDGLEVKWVRIPQDTGRIYGKYNEYGVVKVPDLNLAPNERWFTQEEIIQALLLGELNNHLVEVLAVHELLKAA